MLGMRVCTGVPETRLEVPTIWLCEVVFVFWGFFSFCFFSSVSVDWLGIYSEARILHLGTE